MKIINTALVAILVTSWNLNSQPPAHDLPTANMFRVSVECEECALGGTHIEPTLRVSAGDWSGRVEIWLTYSEKVQVIGETEWVSDLLPGEEFVRQLDVILPANDTVTLGCKVKVLSQALDVQHPIVPTAGCAAAFVTIADSVEYYSGLYWLRQKVDEQRRAIREEARAAFTPHGPGPMVVSVTYVDKDEASGTARLEQFTHIRRRFSCGDVNVTLTPFGGAEVLGPTSWVEHYDTEIPPDYETRTTKNTKWYDVSYPDKTTSGVIMKFSCDRFEQEARVTFVTSGDTAEFWQGHPIAEMPMELSPRTDSSKVHLYPHTFGQQASPAGYKLPFDSVAYRQEKKE